MFSLFKSFVARSNVLKLAVAVITGNAFGSIVTALTDDIIMPLILGQIYGSSGCGFAGSIYRGKITQLPPVKVLWRRFDG